jgi:hypothetical protein
MRAVANDRSVDLPRKKRVEDRTADLLERMLAFQLYTMGIPQDRIAKIVGRQKGLGQ